jgi:serine/threonine protein phosphatase PrpC
MVQSRLQRISGEIRESADPAAKGRELLLEEYRKTDGAGDPRADAMASYELVKSMVVQAAYECGSPGWLSAATVQAELDDAAEEHWLYRRNGMRYLLGMTEGMDPDEPKNALRIRLDEASSPLARFAGSIREHVPGLGYAVSVRKRETMNQDSFLLSPGRPALMAVADGVSGSRFPAIASEAAVRGAGGARSGDPRKRIAIISGRIHDALSDQAMLRAAGTYDGGSTTLTLAVIGEAGAGVYKVGDSLPFRRHGDLAEAISRTEGLQKVVGQPLCEDEVESYRVRPGQLVLTTDGITNYIDGFLERLQRIFSITYDPVIIAENIIRAVLRSQMGWNHADDATVVVQDGGG